MSTKTTFKRIALVAVAALGFGTLSVAPISAAVPQADTVTLSSTATTAYVGGTYTNVVSVGFSALATSDSMTTTMSLTSNVSGSTAFPSVATTATAADLNVSKAATATVFTTTESGTVTAGTVKPIVGTYTVSFTPDKIGTFLISFKNSGGTNNTSAVWTVSVVAKPSLIVAPLGTTAGTVVTKNYAYYAWPSWQASTGQVTAGSWNTWSESVRDASTKAITSRGTDDLTFSCYDIPIYGPSQAAANGLGACMAVKVVQSNGATTAAAGQLTNADAVALTVSVDGPANVSVNGENTTFNANIIPGKVYVEPAGQNADLGLTKYVYVYSNGTPGVATVTISAGTLELEKFTVNFYHTAQKITPTVVNEVIPVTASADLVTTSATYQANNPFSTAGTGAITGKVVDVAGIPVPGLTVRALSDTVATITNSYAACTGLGVGGVTDATGTVTCNLVGAKEGLAMVSLTTLTSATDTTTLANGGATSIASAFRVGGLPTQAKINFGDASGVAKSDFVPGEQGTFSVQLLDAKGLSVPNGTYTDFFSSAVATTPQDLLSTYAFAAQSIPSSTTQTAFLSGSKSPSVGLTAALAAKIDGSGAIQRWLVNMPVNASDVALEVTGYIKGIALNKAVATVAPDKTVQAAADAAAEATDAANAATDAANAAAEAADAATAAAQDAADAVAALATQVATYISNLRKQITALTNLVVKIQKKVKA
jgi:hypothetical protein